MEPSYFPSYFDAVKETISKIPPVPLAHAARLLKNAANFRQRVWLVGNGGSAATAMHFANDLQKVCDIDALALPALISTITAYGNDDGWSKMFSLAMKSFSIGHILVAISFSGTSQNVIEAAKHALECDGKLIVLTGPVWEGNILGNMPGVVIPVEDDDIKVVEDVHLVICHSIVGEIHAMPSVQKKVSQ
jgi:D-sedoheptulose 7-phosphate isomerase